MRNKNILILSPTPIYPADAGNRIRILNVVKYLKSIGANIDFIHHPNEWWWGKLPYGDIDKMREWVREFFLVPVTIPLHVKAINDHHSIDEWWDESIGIFLKWLFSVRDYDAFIVNYTYLSKAFDFCPKDVLKILDTHDRFSGRKELLHSIGLEPEFFYTTAEEEKKGIERADVVWAIKEEEQLFFETMTSRSVVTIPFFEEKGLNCDLKLNLNLDENLIVGILGAKNGLNIKNTKRFLDAAIDIFKNNLAPIEIVLAGSFCEDLVGYSSYKWIKLLGRIDSVDEFYSMVDLVVVPLEKSTGLKIKACEAISFGKATIGMQNALEGTYLSHQYSNINNFTDLANSCVEISFNRNILEGLTLASKQASEILKSRFEDGIQQTFAKHCSSGIMICIGNSIFQKKNHAYEVFSQLANFMSNIDNIYIYIEDVLKINTSLLMDFKYRVNSKVKFVSEVVVDSIGRYGFEVINETFDGFIENYSIQDCVFDLSVGRGLEIYSDKLKRLVLTNVSMVDDLPRGFSLNINSKVNVCKFNMPYIECIDSLSVDSINVAKYRWIPAFVNDYEIVQGYDILINYEMYNYIFDFFKTEFPLVECRFICTSFSNGDNNIKIKNESKILLDEEFILKNKIFGNVVFVCSLEGVLSECYLEIMNRLGVSIVDLRYPDGWSRFKHNASSNHHSDGTFDNDSGWGALWGFMKYEKV